MSIDEIVSNVVSRLKQIASLEVLVKEDRTNLIGLIGPGQNYDHELAKVTITNVTEDRSDPNLLIPSFNAEAYHALSAKDKAKLATQSVVTLKPKFTKGQDSVCRITIKDKG